MNEYPQPLLRLISALQVFPGIGNKTAERMALFLLRQSPEVAEELAAAAGAAKKAIRNCSICHNLTESNTCSVCQDDSRDKSLVMVVEGPRDLLAFERAGVWRGVYHCLMGRISPVEGITERELTIPHLRKRAASGGVTEIVIATNPDMGGDATAMAVARALSGSGVAVSRLARGVPAGHQLDLLAGQILEESLVNRQPLSGPVASGTQAQAKGAGARK